MNTEKQPWASIVVPLHNVEEHAEQLVSCLKAQTCPHFEAILVNDGSTDDTQARLARLTQGDARFRLLYQANAGPGVARNTGLAAAQGVYALFMDADDLVKPLLVERVLAAVRGDAWDAEDTDKTDGQVAGGDGEGAADDARLPQGGPDVVCFQANLLDMRDGQLHNYEEAWDPSSYPVLFDPADHAQTLFQDLRNWPWNKAFRMGFLRSRALRFPALHRSEDLAFTCAALASASTVAMLDECLYTYRVGNLQSSTFTRDAHPSDYFDSACALHDYLADNDLLPTFQNTYRQWVGLGAFLNLVELSDEEAFQQAFANLADGGLARIGIDPAKFEGGDRPVAGRYTFDHAKSVLAAIEGGTMADARAAANAVQRGFEREDRLALYVQDYGSWLGPRLCRATQGIHERKAARQGATPSRR